MANFVIISAFCFVRAKEFINLRLQIIQRMKKDIHPEEYRFVVFKDMSNGYQFLSKSCAPSKDTVTWEDGNEYPLIKLEISHKSHPYFTGKIKLVDTAGRIDKFKNRYAKTMKKDTKKEESSEN